LRRDFARRGFLSAAGRHGAGQAIHQRQEDRDLGRTPWTGMVRDGFPGSFDSPLVPIPLRKLRVRGPAGSLNMTKGFRSTFRGPKGPLFHRKQAEPNFDTRRPRRVSLFFCLCRGGAKRQPARVAARRFGTNKDLVKNAAEELFEAGVFFLTPGRTNGKLNHFPPSEEKQ
jgi:hypothetical protein